MEMKNRSCTEDQIALELARIKRQIDKPETQNRKHNGDGKKTLSRDQDQEVTALYRALLSITQFRNLEDVLHEIVSQTRATLNSTYTSIVLVNEDGSLGIASEDFEDVPPLTMRARPRGVTNRIIASGEPIIIDNVDTVKGTNPVLVKAGIKSYTGVPIKTKDVTIGVLFVHSKERNVFKNKTNLLLAFASQAAIAIENATILNNLKEQQLRAEQLLTRTFLAQEEERKRISIELHDSVAQWLVSASYRMQTCLALLSETNSNGTLDELIEIQNTITKSLDEIRRVTIGLHPPALDELGLTHVLRQAIERLKPYGIDYRFKTKGEPVRLSSSAELAIYRIVQEAITNIRKHSKASEVVLKLQFEPEKVYVEISDNGRGFKLSKAMDDETLAKHMGLLGMRERAAMLGGNLKIKARLGKGTNISLTVPVASLNGVHSLEE